MDKHLRRIDIRRGLSSQRTRVLYEEGEPVYLVDKKRIYVGDSQTFGGNLATNINFVQNDKNIPTNSESTDILIDKSESSGYIINKDSTLTKIFNTCCDGVQKFINDTNNLLDSISGQFCVTGGSTSLEDCQIPIFNKKFLSFSENSTYVLDILNPLKTDRINFDKNLPDGDSNIPPKSIYIIPNSIKVSDNLQIMSSDYSSITLKTGNLSDSASENITVSYDIKNVCGKTSSGVISGFVDPSNIRRFFFDSDYVVISTDFIGGLDLNLYVNFTNPPIQNDVVYFNNKNFSDIIIHGGNNVGENTEYVLVNLKKFKELYPESDFLSLDVKGMWNSKSSNNPIYLNLDLYKGGFFIQNPNTNGFDFVNKTLELHIKDSGKTIPLYKTISRHSVFTFDIKNNIGVLNNS
jgi:hypothetical protein